MKKQERKLDTFLLKEKAFYISPYNNVIIYYWSLYFSGGHFNPAVTLGITLSGGNPVILSIFYFIAQLLGGMVGAAFVLVRSYFPQPILTSKHDNMNQVLTTVKYYFLHIKKITYFLKSVSRFLPLF